MARNVSTILADLERFCPLSLAAAWDKVGVLVRPYSKEEDVPVERVLLTNDLTTAVLNEAIEVETNFIISYHPLLFSPLTTLDANKWKERILAECYGRRIWLYSPHTAWDNMHDGMNDQIIKMLSPLGVSNIKAIKPNPVARDLCIGEGRSFDFMPGNVHLRRVAEVLHHSGYREVGCAPSATNPSAPIEEVLVCVGSGASVFKEAKSLRVPQENVLLLTGELGYHDILDFTQSGFHVVTLGHGNSERRCLQHFRDRLASMWSWQGSTAVYLAKSDREALQWFVKS